MKHNLFLISGVIVIVIGCFLPALGSDLFEAINATLTSSSSQFDPGMPDTVRLGCPVVANMIVPGDSLAIPFYLWNDEELAAFTLGFSYISDDVEITSWSAVGGVIPAAALPFVQKKADPTNNRFLTGWIDLSVVNPIPPTSGNTAQLLGTLYLRILPGATPQAINIDSAFVPPAGEFKLAPVDERSISPMYIDCGSTDVILRGGYPCGDCDGSGIVNASDAIYLVSYIFAGGAVPVDVSVGDVNCDGHINLADAVYLINYVFGSGAAPCAACK